MRRTNKLLSIVLSIAMLVSVVNFVLPMSASAAVSTSNANDGSSELSVANNTDEAKIDVEYNVGGIGGKAAEDVSVWLDVKNDGALPIGGGCYLPCKWWGTGGKGNRVAIAFDVFFASTDAALHFEAQTYDSEGSSSSRNRFVQIGAAEGVKRFGESGSLTEFPENLPESLSCAQWHNVAVELVCDGTNAVNIYIDGVKYECGANADMYGVYRYRLNIMQGSMYIDNYRCLEASQTDDIYAEEDYLISDVSFTDGEKAALDEESGKLSILDSSLTASDVKASVAAEGCNVEVYETAECKTVLADDGVVTQSALVVISNDNGAFRYMDFIRINDSDFEIEEIGDGIGCRVLGYKADVTPDTTKLTIPDTIAGYKVTEIGASAFSAVNVNGGALTLPDTVETIGGKAFYNTYCTVSKWPANLKTIGANAFVHDTITAAAFPTGLKKISNCAFQYAVIKAVPVFNDGLESIGSNAYEWTAIQRFIVPDSVTSLGSNILKTCASSLNTVRFPRNSAVTSVPDGIFNTKDTTSNDYLFKSMSIYIPETITTIPSDLLVNFRDGAIVTIYGASDSAAYTFYEEVKSALEAGTYTNNATYGEEGAYTDSDADGKGEIAEIKFIEYNYDYDCANIIDETDINKGDVLPTLYTPTNDPVINSGVGGVGGKAEDDVVIQLDSKGGGGGQNYLNAAGYAPAFVREISICVPESGSVNAAFGYFTDSSKSSYLTGTAYNVSKNGVSVFGTKICDAKPGQWFNIATVFANGGSNKVKVYVNGVIYNHELAQGSYGVRHFRDYPQTSSKEYTVYYDNLRSYTTDVRTYNVMADAAAQVSAANVEIKITDKGIIFVDENASYTVSQLIGMLKVNESANAAMRVYSDYTFATQLAADDVIEKDAVLVVAAKNGYSFERTYSYYNVNPDVNRTIYDFKVLSEADKTASITGFLEENITEVDDLSAIAIPEAIMGYTVTEVAASAFKDETVIQSVVIPDTVTKIGDNAFAGSSADGKTNGSITDVKLSKNLKAIGQRAFACNSNLKSIELPEGLESIGSYAFYWTGIEEFSVPDSVTKMGSGVCRLCSGLKYIKLSSGVTSVTGDVFYGGGVDVSDIVIPETVTNIAEGVFMNYDMDTTVYGVEGSYAEQWANKYSFKFVPVANVMLVAPKVLGDKEKEIFGTDYDISYGFETLTFDGKLINIGSEDIDALVTVALYDESGLMVEMDSEPVSIPAGKNVNLKTDYDITIPAAKVKDGYTVKGFVWKADSIEPIADETAIEFDNEKQEVHVLLIGNSFGNDSFAFLADIAEADGVVIRNQNMYIGGATLNNHYTNLSDDLVKYQPVIDGVYGTKLTSMKEGLKSDKWDVVALQCASHGFSEDYDFLDYSADGNNSEAMYTYIKDYVSTYAPKAKKVMHMSWGPCDEQSRDMYDARFSNETLYPDASRAVFEAQEAAYKYASTVYSDAEGMMVPSSYAVWYAIDNLGFLEHSGEKASDNTYPNTISGEASIFRDETCHLTAGNRPYGRVLAGLCWYEYLTGNDARENPYQHSGISEADMAKLKEAAHWANTQVTPLSGSAE